MPVSDEIQKLNLVLEGIFNERADIVSKELKYFLAAKSKRLRPKMVFLSAKALGIKIDDEIFSLALAAELAHNAALVHDDIIDNAQYRRDNVSLNAQFGNAISVLAGDILLSCALNQLAETGNLETVSIFAECLAQMSKGEISQRLSMGALPTLLQYIKKSELKTAELFKAPLESLCVIKKLPCKNELVEFARCFGIAFQIKNDLMNIASGEDKGQKFSDIEVGIFTAPVIYLNADNKIRHFTQNRIIELAGKDKYINKTLELIKRYAQKAVSALDFMPENIYKRAIIETAYGLYEADTDEKRDKRTSDKETKRDK